MVPGQIHIVALLAVLQSQGPSVSELADPFLVMAGNEPLNVERGFAAPWYTDWDGDGVRDLLVGQFGDGKLRIYLNTGTDTRQEFSDFFYFQAAGAEGKVPVG